MQNHANVDAAEIEKFNNLAARWWDKEGEFKPLHQINPLRLNYVLAKTEGLFGKKVLDVGCGGGILAESMAFEGAQVTGIDMGADALVVAKLHAKEAQATLDYVLTTAEDHAQSHAKHYDVITCMEMLEHVPDPASIIRACAKMVKPGGQVFFSTLNRNMKSWALAILAAENILKLVPRGTHEHTKFIRPSELIRMANEAKLQDLHITGLHYNPVTDHYSLSARNVDVNYILHCQAL